MFRWNRLQVSAESNLPSNMERFGTALANFANHVSKATGVYTTLILIFSYHVLLNKDLACTCRAQRGDCGLYLIMPVFILLTLMLWMDRTFQRAWKYSCRRRKAHFVCLLCRHVLKAAVIGMLWVAFVLIDGDWFVCCSNYHFHEQPLLACRDKEGITVEEQRLINELLNTSRVSFYLSVLTTSWLSLLRAPSNLVVVGFLQLPDPLTRNLLSCRSYSDWAKLGCTARYLFFLASKKWRLYTSTLQQQICSARNIMCSST